VSLMARIRAPLALLFLLALAGCGGPLFSAEVVVDRFCFTQRLTALPPTPVAGAVTTPPVAVPFQVPPGLRTHGSRVLLRLEDGRVASATAGVFLDGVTRLDLLLQPAAGDPVTAAHYAKPAGASSVSALALSGQGVDVSGLLQSGTLQVIFSIASSGPPPAAAWDADLELCFYGRTVISYF
jgi:hypothetical protein